MRRLAETHCVQAMQSEAKKTRESTDMQMAPVTGMQPLFLVDHMQFKAWQHDASELDEIFKILESDEATLRQKKLVQDFILIDNFSTKLQLLHSMPRVKCN